MQDAKPNPIPRLEFESTVLGIIIPASIILSLSEPCAYLIQEFIPIS
jgi:hypothetical protein